MDIYDPAEDAIHILKDMDQSHRSDRPLLIRQSFTFHTYVLREEHGAGVEGLSEHLDEQVELSQVLSTICHEAPHQLVVTLLLIG